MRAARGGKAASAAAQDDRPIPRPYWSEGKGFYESRRDVVNGEPGKELDFAMILAVIHAGRKAGAHSVRDPKVMATLTRLEELFDASYKSTGAGRKTSAPPWGVMRATAISAAAPIIFRRSAQRNSIIRSPERWQRAPIFRRRRRTRHSWSGSAWSKMLWRARRGRPETLCEASDPARRPIHGDGCRLYARIWRAVGAIRPGNRRPDVGKDPRLEPCRLHHRFCGAPRGRRARTQNVAFETGASR